MKSILSLSALLLASVGFTSYANAAPTFDRLSLERHIDSFAMPIAATGKDKMAKKGDGQKEGKKGAKSNHPQLVALREKYKALREEVGKNKDLQGKLKEAFKAEAMALRKELGLSGKGKGQKPPKGQKAGKGDKAGMKKKKQTDA